MTLTSEHIIVEKQELEADNAAFALSLATPSENEAWNSGSVEFDNDPAMPAATLIEALANDGPILGTWWEIAKRDARVTGTNSEENAEIDYVDGDDDDEVVDTEVSGELDPHVGNLLLQLKGPHVPGKWGVMRSEDMDDRETEDEQVIEASPKGRKMTRKSSNISMISAASSDRHYPPSDTTHSVINVDSDGESDGIRKSPYYQAGEDGGESEKEHDEEENVVLLSRSGPTYRPFTHCSQPQPDLALQPQH
jgi:hypothetical protein